MKKRTGLLVAGVIALILGAYLLYNGKGFELGGGGGVSGSTFELEGATFDYTTTITALNDYLQHGSPAYTATLEAGGDIPASAYTNVYWIDPDPNSDLPPMTYQEYMEWTQGIVYTTDLALESTSCGGAVYCTCQATGERINQPSSWTGKSGTYCDSLAKCKADCKHATTAKCGDGWTCNPGAAGASSFGCVRNPQTVVTNPNTGSQPVSPTVPPATSTGTQNVCCKYTTGGTTYDYVCKNTLVNGKVTSTSYTSRCTGGCSSGKCKTDNSPSPSNFVCQTPKVLGIQLPIAPSSSCKSYQMCFMYATYSKCVDASTSTTPTVTGSDACTADSGCPTNYKCLQPIGYTNKACIAVGGKSPSGKTYCTANSHCSSGQECSKAAGYVCITPATPTTTPTPSAILKVPYDCSNYNGKCYSVSDGTTGFISNAPSSTMTYAQFKASSSCSGIAGILNLPFCTSQAIGCSMGMKRNPCGNDQTCVSGQGCVANGYTIQPTTPYCGDGLCTGADTCSNCPQDCGACQIPTPVTPPTPTDYCGDTICSGDDTCTNCPQDCGACTPPTVLVICGDGVCEAGDLAKPCCVNDCGTQCYPELPNGTTPVTPTPTTPTNTVTPGGGGGIDLSTDQMLLLAVGVLILGGVALYYLNRKQ